MKEEGSQAPTHHTPVAPILETMSVAPEILTPSTSAGGAKITHDEQASQGRGDIVVYALHIPVRKCGAYRKELAKLRREAEGNIRRPPAARSGTNSPVQRGPEEEEGGGGHPALGQDTTEGGLWAPWGLGRQRPGPQGGRQIAQGKRSEGGEGHGPSRELYCVSGKRPKDFVFIYTTNTLIQIR